MWYLCWDIFYVVFVASTRILRYSGIWSALLCDLLDASTALAACFGLDLCHKYILYLYLYLGIYRTSKSGILEFWVTARPQITESFGRRRAALTDAQVAGFFEVRPLDF